MRKLTDNQIDFLVHNFFRHEDRAGWRELGRILVERGSCIVAGCEPIWRGGIGNWINTSQPEGAVGCLLYEFNLGNFITSHWFISLQQEYLSEINKKRVKLSEEFMEISALETIK